MVSARSAAAAASIGCEEGAKADGRYEATK